MLRLGSPEPAANAARLASVKRAARDGLFVAGLVVLVATTLAVLLNPSYAVDARAYWEAARGDMYARPGVGTFGAYLYSPVFLQALAPLFALPWPMFLAAWMAILAGTLVWLTRAWLPLAVVTLIALESVSRGNIEVLMAAAIVVGFRFPAAWAFVLLTKVTPGVGLVWFLARREWRHLGIALGATILLAVVSFVFAPELWAAWIASLQANARTSPVWTYLPVPIGVRLPVAAAVVAYGAVRGWRWVVPVGATLAMPALWPINMALLVALPRVLRGPQGQDGTQDHAELDTPPGPGEPPTTETAGVTRA
jgi:hypothetical protein